MSALVAVGALFTAPSFAGPPPQPTEAEQPVRAADLQRLYTEMRELRQAIEAERAENLRLRDLERDRPVSSHGRPEERVGFGQDVYVGPAQEVEDVVGFGSDVRIDGVVRGNATSFGGNVIVTGSGVVYGDALSFGGRVEVQDGGRIRGDRIALEDPTGATLTADLEPESTVGSFLSSLYRRIVLLLSFAGAGVLVIGLFPGRVDRIAQDLESRPFWSAMLGTTATVLLTVFAVLFALLTLGLGPPVSALLMAWLGAAWLFGFVGLCQTIGDRLPFANKPHGRWLTFLVGTGLLSCLGSLPWVGWLVVFVASMLGVGASITSRFGGR